MATALKSRMKHSGKNMDVVLIKEMLQLGSIVSLSLAASPAYVIKRRSQAEEKTAKLSA